MRAPSPPCDRLDLAHPRLTGSSRVSPSTTARYFSAGPFGFHLAMDTLPSEVQQVESREQAQWLLVSRWLLAGLSLRRLSPVWRGSVSCFCSSNNLLHFLGQRGITPVFGYGAPHLSARGT